MARNRMLNPEFWLDEEIAKLSPHARLLYMGTWGICDDNHATFPDRPDWLKVQIFPYEDVDIRVLLNELSGVGKLLHFEFEGKKYWYIKNFFKYQKIDRPSKAKYPEFKPFLTQSLQTLDEGSTRARPEAKGKEKNIRDKVATLEEVTKTITMKKSAFKYREDQASDVFEDVIDLDTGEQEKSKPKGSNSKIMRELVEWAVNFRGRPFVNMGKQYKALSKLKEANISPNEIKNRWTELSGQKFYEENGLDFMSVASSFDKKPL